MTDQNTQPGSSLSPYVMIDQTRFQILPAVPGLRVFDISKKKNLIVTSGNTKARGNKAINTAGDVFVSDLFNPVPAVPNEGTTDVNLKQNVVNSFPMDSSIAPKVNVNQENALFSRKEERKRFKKCHGQCVQKSCFPIDSLTVFNNCSEHCRNVCTN